MVRPDLSVEQEFRVIRTENAKHNFFTQQKIHKAVINIIEKNNDYEYLDTEEIKEYLNSPHSWPTASDLSHAASLIRSDHTFLARAKTILAYIMYRTRIN